MIPGLLRKTTASFPAAFAPSRLSTGLIRGDDWQSYSADTDAGFLTLWGSAGAYFTNQEAVDLVIGGNAGIFGKVARCLHPTLASDPNRCTEPVTTKFCNGAFTATDHAVASMCFRLDSNWTPAGSCGQSTGNAMKWIHFYTNGNNPANRFRTEWENTGELNFGLSISSLFTETKLVPNLMAQPAGTQAWPTPTWGTALATLRNGEWWQCVMSAWRQTSLTGMHRVWMRQLTTGGGTVYAPDTWYFQGRAYTDNGSSNAFPQIDGGVTFTTRNRTPDEDMYFWVGPSEYADATDVNVSGDTSWYSTLLAMHP